MSNACTVVTAYYRFPSKHANAEYDQWMKTFLQTVEGPMVIFTDEQMGTQLLEYRKDHLSNTRLYVVPLHQLHYAQEPYVSYWQKDWQRDPERDYHNPLLYILWNEKTRFVERAIQKNPFDTAFYAWCDIGMMRHPHGQEIYRTWPDPRVLATLEHTCMHLLNIEPFQSGEGALLPNGLTAPFGGKNRIGGGVLLGGLPAWQRWTNLFEDTICRYMHANYFAGKDQSVMATLAFRHPDVVHLITPKPYTLGDGSRGDPWFYMLKAFAWTEEEGFNC